MSENESQQQKRTRIREQIEASRDYWNRVSDECDRIEREQGSAAADEYYARVYGAYVGLPTGVKGE